MRVLQRLHPHMSSPQVLIVGRPTRKNPTCNSDSHIGGPTAALVLRKNGIAVRLRDKALDYQIGVRGNGIQDSRAFKIFGQVTDIFDNCIEPSQMRACDGKPVIRTWDFGVKEPVTPAVPYVRANLFYGLVWLFFLLAFSSSPQPNPGILGQSNTGAILRSHLSQLGVIVELGTQLVDFTQDAHKVTANPLIRDKSGSSENETMEVDWGLLENTSGSTSGRNPGEQAFLVAHVEMEGLDHEYWAADGSTTTGLVMALHLGPALHFSVVGNRTPEEIQKVVDGGFDAFKALSEPNIRCADKLNIGGVSIAGDGAHVHFPMSGQGLNSSVQDAGSSISPMVNWAWKLSLVVKILSPRSLLSTCEIERMHPIKEILKLTTNLHTQSKSDRDPATSQSVNPGSVREHTFKQLGANYPWSEIVFDQRVDTKNVNMGNKVYTPYGNDEPIQAGDHAPDAPNLVFVPIAAELIVIMTLPMTPFAHTTLVFKLPESQLRAHFNSGILHALGKHNKDGHMASMPTQVRKSLPSVVVIRPDACIGAFVHDPQGVAKYFSKICLYVAVQLQTLLSSLDTIQKVLGLTHLSWLVASIEEFPGIPTHKRKTQSLLVEPVKHANRIRSSCFSSSTRAREITSRTIPLLLDFKLRTLKILQVSHIPYFLVIHWIRAPGGRQPSPLTLFISRVYYIAHAKHRYSPPNYFSTSRMVSHAFANIKYGVDELRRVADERTQTPTPLATEGTADPKDSPAYSASSSPYPLLSPSPHSSSSPHPPSSQSPSPTLRPSRLHHASVRNFIYLFASFDTFFIRQSLSIS
ncbi:hypothetical protein BS47DRAFT_1398613 [Hydnum rufescens UP504]|uniref:FAD-binding domain-containing protein n=1 Tax=Hydnum rufescens UP504 TaxID=1448309 RepID=A0A9P6AKF6_9AGAM|nr:hypothetical protein BS47DRAFT_1398613 [Hydnum rufescens UP504]